MEKKIYLVKIQRFHLGKCNLQWWNYIVWLKKVEINGYKKENCINLQIQGKEYIK